MFNIKNIVNKITDRGRESQPNSPGRGHGEDILSKQAAEGFLCPKCMKAFPSPEELQSHYVSSHDGDGEGAIPDLPTMSNTLGFLSLHQEVGERYKRQEGNSLQDISVVDVQAISDPVELKKRLIEALENGALLQHEKERLEQRAAQLARDNVSLKAASDEGEGNQAALKERLKVVEAQLAHRESIDDAAVLRQELVQVQRVMDELTREKERERDQLKTELQQLKDFNAMKEVTNNSNEQTCSAEVQSRLDELEAMLKTRDSIITELQTHVEIYKKELNGTEMKLQQELSRSQLLEQELEVQKQNLSDALEENRQKLDDFKQGQDEYVEVKRERDHLKDSLEKLQQNGANEIKILTQKTEEIKMKYDTALKEIEEKEEAIKSAQSRLDALNKQKDILKSELTHKSKVCEEFEKSNTSMHEKIKEVEKSLSNKKEEISRLESERAELLVQIQAGEGANTAIQQLSQEKVLLSNQLKEQIQHHTMYVKEMSSKLEDAAIQIHDLEIKNEDMILQLSNHENRLQTVSSELQESQKKVSRLTDDVKKKEIALQELHSSEDHFKSEKESCEKRITVLESQLQEKSSLLTDYIDKIQSMEAILQNNKRRIDALDAKNDLLQAKLRQQELKINELDRNLTATKSKLEDSASKAEDLGAELENKIAHVSELEAENVKLANKITSLKESLKEKEEQLQVLGVQRASLETSLFELSAEVEEDKKRIDDKWKKDMESIKSLLENSQEKIAELEEGKKMVLGEKSEMEKQIATLEENLEKAQKNLHENQTALQNQLSAVTAAKEKTEEELTAEKSKCTQLQKDNKDLKEEYEAEFEKKGQELKHVQASLDEVTGEKLVLEAQFAASQSEQQALLERCYASSSESENLRKTIADLRRRLEESQAALHELGRENQTLQLELEKLVGRKWTEDSDAISCGLCQKEFSILVRKHHCRNCGQIFCNECSSKMAPITNNKKPVRVCDSCYNELGSK